MINDGYSIFFISFRIAASQLREKMPQTSLGVVDHILHDCPSFCLDQSIPHF
jgi:hypothetical protein